MVLKIDRDIARFRDKLQKAKKDAFKKYLKSDTLAIPGRNGTISIPVPRIVIPRFRFREEGQGIGSGEGKEGDELRNVNPNGDGWGFDNQSGPIRVPRGEGRERENEKGDGSDNGHGSESGNHSLLDFTQEEIADILGEELKLPNLKDQMGGGGDIETTKNRYKGIRSVGPVSLRHFRRTYRQTLKRYLANGIYDPEHPLIVPRREDMRFRAPVEIQVPNNKATIIFLLDFSGSMYDVIGFLKLVGWIADGWIRHHYQKVERRYVHYDSLASETNAENFYQAGANGGTDMLEGLAFVTNIGETYPSDRDLYLIHFTDGDSYGVWSEEILNDPEFWARDGPHHRYESKRVQMTHPLIDFIIPRFSGVFVCEAGAYYDELNYSELFAKLIEKRPALERKLRMVSYKEEEIKNEPNRLMLETIKHWFAASNSANYTEK